MNTEEHDNAPSGKEAYEAKKREKEIARSEESKSTRGEVASKKWSGIGVAMILLALIVGGLIWWLSTLGPKGEDRSVFFDSMGREHVANDATLPVYNSNPPTSGPHYSVPARGGFREEDIADGHIIHSLEHGFVWISYQSDVPQSVVEQLKEFAGNMVIVTQRDDNDTDIAVAAWTRLDTWNLPEDGTLDEQRIDDFIARYLNRGPERITGSHGGI